MRSGRAVHTTSIKHGRYLHASVVVAVSLFAVNTATVAPVQSLLSKHFAPSATKSEYCWLTSSPEYDLNTSAMSRPRLRHSQSNSLSMSVNAEV